MTGRAAAAGRGTRASPDGLVERLERPATGEPEENGGQLIRFAARFSLSRPAGRAARQRPKLVDRAARDDAALEDDADAVAHLLGDFERVRAHEDRDAAFAHPP